MPYTPPVFHRSTSSATRTERFRKSIHHVSDPHSNSNSTSTRTTDSVSSFLEQFISHVFSYRHSRSGLSSWWMRTLQPGNTGYRENAACRGKNVSSVGANTPRSSPESTTSPCQSHENLEDSSSSTSFASRPAVMQTVVKRPKPIGHSRHRSSPFHTHHVSRKGYVKRQTAASTDPEAESSSSVGSSSSSSIGSTSSIGSSSSSFDGLSISISISIGLPLFPDPSSLPPSGSTTTQTSETSTSETSTSETSTSETSTLTTSETSTPTTTDTVTSTTTDTSTSTSTTSTTETSLTTTSTTLSTTSDSTSDTTFSTTTESSTESSTSTSSSTSLTSSSTIPATITFFSTTPTSSSSSSRSVITLTANSTSISTNSTSVSSTSTTTTFTLFPTTTTTTDLPTITDASPTSRVPSLTTSGVLNTQTPSFSSRFAQNQGAIIGVTVGGVVALVLIVTAVFFFCARWRRTRHTAQTPAAATSGLTRGSSKATGSRRTLMRNPSSNISWRPPLSDEYDDDPEDHVQMSQVPMAHMVAGVGVPTSPSHSSHEGDVSLSTSGHGHSSNLSHEQSPPSSPPVPSTSQTGVEMTRRPSLPRQMPGLGQVSETMRITTVELSPSSPPVSPTFSLSPQPLPTAAYGSSSSHGHSSTELGGSSSLVHSNTMITTASSSSGSHSHSHSSHHATAPIPRVRIQEASPNSSLRQRTSSTGSFRGLISRLRGGRSSTQDLPSGSLKGKGRANRVPAPASFYYPGTSLPNRASSLLNPPLPLSFLSQEPAEIAPFSVTDLPLPTPDEELGPEGLLDPQLLTKELPTRPSLGSLRDNVDYSRPYRGFVFNRMGSSTTFATQDTRRRTPGVETPGSLYAYDDTLGERNEFPFGTTTPER